MFTDFVRTFQQHTVDRGRLGTQEIMYKYIATFEHLAPRFGTETFPVSHLELSEDGDGSSTYSTTTHAQGVSKDNFRAPATHEIMVSGNKGIQWRKMSIQKVCQNTVIPFYDDKIHVTFPASVDFSFIPCLYIGAGQLLPKKWLHELHQENKTTVQPVECEHSQWMDFLLWFPWNKSYSHHWS